MAYSFFGVQDNFNPRPSVRGDSLGMLIYRIDNDFNPHPSVRGDP